MKHRRISEIEKYIMKEQAVTLTALTEEFGVSLNTIRRDLKQVLKNPCIEKCYGGVRVAKIAPVIIPYSERVIRYPVEKAKIGEMAASMVKDGMCIFLDSGTTTMTILPHIAERKQVHILTHSLTVLNEAIKYPSLSVFALGGQYNPDTRAFYSFATGNPLENLSIDICFLATVGISLQGGLSNMNFLDTQFKSLAIKNANQCVLMADNSKFGVTKSFTFGNISDLSKIITDRPLLPEYELAVEAAGVELLYPEKL